MAGEIDGYTASGRPVEVLWTEEFQHINDAIVVERQIKDGSRAKKAALFAGDRDRLQALSVRASRRSAAQTSSA